MKEFTETDYKIIAQIYQILLLLGANADLLSIIGSWKETQSDDDILTMLKGWKRDRIFDLSERIKQCK